MDFQGLDRGYGALAEATSTVSSACAGQRIQRGSVREAVARGQTQHRWLAGVHHAVRSSIGLAVVLRSKLCLAG